MLRACGVAFRGLRSKTAPIRRRLADRRVAATELRARPPPGQREPRRLGDLSGHAEGQVGAGHDAIADVFPMQEAQARGDHVAVVEHAAMAQPARGQQA